MTPYTSYQYSALTGQDVSEDWNWWFGHNEINLYLGESIYSFFRPSANGEAGASGR